MALHPESLQNALRYYKAYQININDNRQITILKSNSKTIYKAKALQVIWMDACEAMASDLQGTAAVQ